MKKPILYISRAISTLLCEGLTAIVQLSLASWWSRNLSRVTSGDCWCSLLAAVVWCHDALIRCRTVTLCASIDWRFSYLVVTAMRTSTKLLFAEPG